MRYTFNIGIEDPKALVTIAVTMYKLLGKPEILHVEIQHGQWHGEEQATLVVVTEITNRTPAAVLSVTQNMCELFGQECIALKDVNDGKLVYNSSYKGKRNAYREELFLHPKDAARWES